MLQARSWATNYLSDQRNSTRVRLRHLYNLPTTFGTPYT